jgi:hypothetical protein
MVGRTRGLSKTDGDALANGGTLPIVYGDLSVKGPLARPRLLFRQVFLTERDGASTRLGLRFGRTLGQLGAVAYLVPIFGCSPRR